VVSTSDYKTMRDRLMKLINQQKDEQKQERPRLRVTPGAGRPQPENTGDDGRPTVRRQDHIQ
jgi:hypothetical protein